MNTADFDFTSRRNWLPKPLEKTWCSKLLIVNCETGEMQDKHFHSIIDMLEPGDTLYKTPEFSLPRLWSKVETGGHGTSSLRTLVRRVEAPTNSNALAQPRISFGDTPQRCRYRRIDPRDALSAEYQGIFLEVLESLGRICHLIPVPSV